jgi:hypothetical protein
VLDANNKVGRNDSKYEKEAAEKEINPRNHSIEISRALITIQSRD